MRCFQQEIHINGRTVLLDAYLPNAVSCGRYQTDRSAVLVLPGGAYAKTADLEGEVIALQYVAAGICSFVLHYSVYPARFPQALLEAWAAIRYIRENAENFGVDPQQIAVCGFSAGGHLAASTGTLWNKRAVEGISDEERVLSRPNRMILCYPVIGGEFHRRSMLNLFEQHEEELTEERWKLLSLHRQVDEETPPAFLWHNNGDVGVPCTSSLAFATALCEKGIPAELHIYSGGAHGVGLGNYLTRPVDYDDRATCDGWIQQSIDYLYRMRKSEEKA